MAFDVITPARFGQGEVAIAPLWTTLRTTPAGQVDMIKAISIANAGSGAASVSIHIVPEGDAPTDANVLVPAAEIAANTVANLETSQIMNAGDTLQAQSSAAGVCVTVSGGEVV